MYKQQQQRNSIRHESLIVMIINVTSVRVYLAGLS